MNDAFECELLRREVRRLLAVNRTLEARLALAEGERDRLRSYVTVIERSRPWRVAQKLRALLGRQW
ncbi:MAG TPA: hypothetical protein VMU84_15660 [Thermoanaerobaculia bacterium]|nr:hypothetical protein [Thermoanaerobaculia bacterium]